MAEAASSIPPASVTIWSWNQELPEVSKFSPVAGAYIERSSKRTDNNELASSGSSIDRDAERDAASATADTSTFSNAPRNYECEASGSRPPANITWFLDGQPLDPTLSQTTFQENVTTSMLSLPVTVREGKLLECRATNGKLPESRGVVSQFLKMDLSQRMEVSVLLGSRLNGSNINEGDDVYMECSVLAASPVTEISWRQDGRELKTGDKTPGLLFSSRFLVIQNVALSNAGRYTCRSTSADGEMAESAPFELRIRHRPRCRATQVRMLEARTNETVNVSCDVKADPDDGLRYLWVAEDDAGHRRRSWRAGSGESADDDHAQEVSSSRLEVLVDTFLFHATLYCWAKNDVGTQRSRADTDSRLGAMLQAMSAIRLARVENATSALLCQQAEWLTRTQPVDIKKNKDRRILLLLPAIPKLAPYSPPLACTPFPPLLFPAISAHVPLLLQC
ncbi:hypothetical protein HPB48_010108 [Haemaphysalis longicornis]|uniref:Ig-like domain-containing protein n=1 Tax=Haemaphysalis longicornis TaxID=44386 RepID=A0A9J6FLT2_HAELO|nr:hypothetical protein HPB48_010108 [Haemaphysalis longicornis]